MSAGGTPSAAVRVERVSRRFRVRSHDVRTLKELLLAGGRGRATDVWALRDVSFAVAPGESVGLVGRNGSGKTTLLKLLAGIVRPTDGTVAVAGRIGSLLELGAGFHPDFSGRENVYLNASVHGLGRSFVRERLDEIVAFAELEEFIDLPVRTYSSGMYMRLGFAVAAHIEADVLLLDEVFAVGDEAFQRKCFGKIFEHKQRGGTILFVSHDASAVERLCERAVLLERGRVAFDGPTHEAMVRYGSQLAAEEDPEERAGGLREWGTGEAHIVDVELVGREGAGRTQFLAGEPLELRLRIVCERPLPPPRRTWELRGEGGTLVAAGAVPTDELAVADGAREVALRWEVDRLPLAEGRFHVRLGLTDATGEHLLHWLDDALTFIVYPEGEERGALRLEGRWTMEETTAAAEMGTR